MSNKVTILPDYADIVQMPTVEFYKTATNLLQVFEEYTGQISLNIDFEKSKISDSVIIDTAKLYDTLNTDNFKITYNGTEYEFDNIYKLYYIEKFDSLHLTLKQAITSQFTGDNVYFDSFSDDVGTVVDSKNAVNTGTSPIYDEFNQDYQYPSGVPGSLYNKISNQEKENLASLESLTSTLHKTHLQGLQSNVQQTTAKTAHGDNLVTDVLYIDILSKLKDPAKSKIKEALGEMADFIEFFKTINPRDQDVDRVSKFFKYTLTDMEGIQEKIDILKNTLDNSLSPKLA